MKHSKQNGFSSIALLIVVLLVIIGAGVYFANKNKTDNIPATENPEGGIISGETVDLSSRGLTKAPDYIFNQKDTVNLDLSNNSITGALQSQVQNLQSLEVLNLSNNKFTGVPAEVGQLKKLKVLNLSNNQLTGLPNELGNLRNLKLLDLSGNSYSETDLSGIRKNLPTSTTIKTD